VLTIDFSPLQTPGPSLLGPVLSTFPQLPGLVQTAASVVQSFTNALTPFSPVSVPLHNGLAVTVQINLAGAPIGAAISLSTAGLNAQQGLLNIPTERGYRAFDVFYHLLSSATTDSEREYLALKRPEDYKLLARSGTYTLPANSPTADDEAAAEDFRAGLRALNIKKADLRGLLSILASLLLLGNSLGLLLDEEVVEEVCEDVASLLGVEPDVLAKKIGESEREIFIETVYELLVEWVIYKANLALADDFAEQNRMAGLDGSEGGDSVTVAVLEVPNEKMGRALCLKNVFDDENGLNLEMSQDGVKVLPSSGTVVREMKQCWIDAEKDGLVGSSRDREYIKDRQEGIIEKVGREAEDGAFLKEVLFPQEVYDQSGIPRTKIDVFQQLSASRVWYHLNVLPVDPSSEPTNGKWSAAVVSKQLRAWRLPEWANRRVKKLDFTSDFDMEEFPQRYQLLGCRPGRDGVETWVIERGWSNGDVVVGSERVWMSETSWWEAEQMLDLKPMGVAMDTGYSAATSMGQSGYFGNVQDASRDNLLRGDALAANNGYSGAGGNGGNGPGQTLLSAEEEQKYTGALDPEVGKKKKIVAQPIGMTRKIWVAVVWALTFWIPSFLLRYVGRMKRPDVRMAWREKLVLVFGILFLNAFIIFYIIFFGKIICPNYDKAWTARDVEFHSGEEDYWGHIRGVVYDFSKCQLTSMLI
jgi:chitin synthase